MHEKRIARRVVAVAAWCGILAAILGVLLFHFKKSVTLQGAVIADYADPNKQSPITDATVTAKDDLAQNSAKSDFSGYFKLLLRPGVKRGRVITLRIRHPDYLPIDLNTVVSDNLSIVRMTSAHRDMEAQSNRPDVAVANVLVRYSVGTTTAQNVGAGVKTFLIENKGNVPCAHRPPCSPDGKWKAAISSAALDAGQGNVYEDARISCIAGPCPFTRIVSDRFSHGGREITVSVLDWSDTAVFLLQAEVFRQEVGDIVQESYPVIFGGALNFTLPSGAEGPTLEAEINGANIIFPLGPGQTSALSWANCNVKVQKDQTKSYRCELKRGYIFR
jgi:hypothetical protein